MFKAHDRIAQCFPEWRTVRAVQRMDFIVVHQHGKKLPRWTNSIETAEDLAEAHTYHPELKGITGRLPYHLVISDIVEQGIPLGKMGAHAGKYNYCSVAIAVLGQFHEHQPPLAQWMLLVQTCALLQRQFPDATVVGHARPVPTDSSGAVLYLPGGSSVPNKRCPGKALDIEHLRYDIADSGLACEDIRPHGFVL